MHILGLRKLLKIVVNKIPQLPLLRSSPRRSDTNWSALGRNEIMQILMAKTKKASGWVVFKIAKAATNQHMEIPIARGLRSLPFINN